MKKFNDYLMDAPEMTDAEVNAAFCYASDARSREKSRAANRRKTTANKKKQRWNDRHDVTGFEAADKHEELVLRGMGGKHQTMNSKVHTPNHRFEMGVGNKRRDEIAEDKMNDVHDDVIEVV